MRAASDLTLTLQRLDDARARLDALAATLPDDGWIGPHMAGVNPPLWEYGHIVWFEEHWCLRQRPGRDPSESPLLEPLAPSVRPWADWRYNSSHIPHAARWSAPLLDRDDVRAYGREVRERVRDRVARGNVVADLPYFAELALTHELMHTEAWWMMWQTRGLTPPCVPGEPRTDGHAGGAIRIDRGTVTLGSPRDAGFVFDNEKWAHDVAHDAFEIDAQPVTCGAFIEFIAAGGYDDERWWDTDARAWRMHAGARHPRYWRPGADGGWEIRRFDRWQPVDPGAVLLHVTRHEAAAYARWRGRRLPGVAEWVRAYAEPGFASGLCWEWTTDMFEPYAGFEADPYRDYSVPWFGSHCELRGAGSCVTDPLIARPTYRNFFMPDRADVFVGFRTARAA